MESANILARLRESLGLSSDTALAAYLGTSQGVLSGWKTRGIGNYDLIFAKCDGVDLNYVIRGAALPAGGEKAPGNREIEALYRRIETLEEEKREYWALIKKLTDK